MLTPHKRGALLTLFLLTGAQLWGAGYEFEGVGARQVARGGAAIADADDWTAIYWNPGNIALKRSSDTGIEIFGGELFARDPNSLTGIPGLPTSFSKNTIHSNFILGAVGAVLPVGERGGIGFGVYTPLLQGADFQAVGNNGATTMDFQGSATILTGNISGSYRFTDRISAGAGVNILYGRLMSDILTTNVFGANDSISSKQDGDGVGLEGIFGMRGEINDKLSLGAVYRTGSDIHIKGDAATDYSGTNPLIPANQRSGFDFELRHPPTWGIGAAYRPSARWTHSLDYNQTLWHRFSNETHYDNQNVLLTDHGNGFDWKDSWKIRLGTRWKMSKKNELMAGYAYDIPALDGQSVDFSTSVDVYMNRLGLGFAHVWNEHFETTFGVNAGYGERTINNQTYRLSGYHFMLETRFGTF